MKIFNSIPARGIYCNNCKVDRDEKGIKKIELIKDKRYSLFCNECMNFLGILDSSKQPIKK